ncbi:hypothetical protein ACK31S_20060, partial [Aeromonas caviae]
GVFGDNQFTSTLSVNFHFPRIPRRTFFYAAPKRQPPPDFATNSDCGPHPSSSTDDCHLQSKVAASLTRFSSLFHYTTHQQRHARHFFMQKHEILRINIQKSSGKYQP